MNLDLLRNIYNELGMTDIDVITTAGFRMVGNKKVHQHGLSVVIERFDYSKVITRSSFWVEVLVGLILDEREANNIFVKF